MVPTDVCGIVTTQSKYTVYLKPSNSKSYAGSNWRVGLACGVDQADHKKWSPDQEYECCYHHSPHQNLEQEALLVSKIPGRALK